MINITTNVLILGGGMIGQQIARSFGLYQWTMLDNRIDHPLAHLENLVPVDDAITALDTLDGSKFTYCVNTLPIYDPDRVLDILDWCARNKVHYLDISEDVLVGAAIQDWCNKNPDAGIMVAPHCGLAPGVVSIIAAGLAKKFQTINHLELYVGALPLSASNHLRYHATWSPEGVVNEYIKPCTVIENREKFTYDVPFSGLKTVVIDGSEYEAFYTSGGMSTLADRFSHAQTVSYRTLRYPGHADACKSILYPPNPRTAKDYNPKRLLEQLQITQSLTPCLDKIVIHINVVGQTEDFRHRSAVYSKTIYGTHEELGIQIATAAGPLTVIDLHENKKIESGYVRQDDIPFDYAQESPYFRPYRIK